MQSNRGHHYTTECIIKPWSAPIASLHPKTCAKTKADGILEADFPKTAVEKIVSAKGTLIADFSEYDIGK